MLVVQAVNGLLQKSCPAIRPGIENVWTYASCSFIVVGNQVRFEATQIVMAQTEPERFLVGFPLMWAFSPFRWYNYHFRSLVNPTTGSPKHSTPLHVRRGPTRLQGFDGLHQQQSNHTQPFEFLRKVITFLCQQLSLKSYGRTLCTSWAKAFFPKDNGHASVWIPSCHTES